MQRWFYLGCQMWVGSRCMYQFKAIPPKLSWKKCINNFSSCIWLAIFMQYIVIWLLGQVVPWYFSNSGALNLGGIFTYGTKHKSATSLNHNCSPPSMAVILSSNISILIMVSSSSIGSTFILWVMLFPWDSPLPALSRFLAEQSFEN